MFEFNSINIVMQFSCYCLVYWYSVLEIDFLLLLFVDHEDTKVEQYFML